MIFMTGDTHGHIDIKKLNTRLFPQQKSLSKNDYLIIAGDFGCIWDGSKQDKYWLDWLEKKNFTTLFVDGNHENFDLLNQYPLEEWNSGKVHRINSSVFHLMRGQVFTIDGLKIFTFGGGLSIDKQYREPSASWWPEEIPSKLELEEALINLDLHNNTVDYIITHTAPSAITEQLNEFKISDPVCHMLDLIYSKITYKKWFFGHFHVDCELDNGFLCLYNKIHKVSSL